MRTRPLIRSLLILLALPTAVAAAADLKTIDRSIRKQPTYRSQTPKYCLAVFGPAAETRVWLVLDDDALYIDRNANGDLTDDGERLPLYRSVKRPEPRNPIGEVREFMDLVQKGTAKSRDVPMLTPTARYTRFYLSQYLPKPDFVSKTAEQAKFLGRLRKNLVHFVVLIDGKFGQDARAFWTDNPRTAPIVHLDGPLTLELAEPRPELVRGAEPIDLSVRLLTRGLGEDTFAAVESDSLPAHVHPVAEIEFPPSKPGERPISKKFVLKQRC